MRRAGNECRNFEHRSRLDFLFLFHFICSWCVFCFVLYLYFCRCFISIFALSIKHARWFQSTWFHILPNRDHPLEVHTLSFYCRKKNTTYSFNFQVKLLVDYENPSVFIFSKYVFMNDALFNLWKLDCLILSNVLYFPLLRLSSNWRTLWRKSVKLQVVGLSSLSILTTWSFHHLHFIYRYFSTNSSCSQRKTMLTLAWILPTTWRTWKRTWICTRW